jgi:hypothetical protein
MLQTFEYNGKTVRFDSSSSVKTVISFFLYDGLCELRTQVSPDGNATKEDCLSIVAYAADRVSELTYIHGTKVKLGDEVADVFREMDQTTLDRFYEQSLRSQCFHPARASDPDAIPAAIESYASDVARAVVQLLLGDPTSASPNDTQIQATTELFAAVLSQCFQDYHTYTMDRIQSGPVYCLDFIPYKMWQTVIDMLPTMAERATGMSYPEFLAGGHMAPAGHAALQGRYSPYGNYIVQGVPHQVDRDRLNALLAELSFASGNISLVKQCQISYAEPMFPALGEEQRLYLSNNETAISPDLLPFPLFSAGYADEGVYYLQSSHYYAPLTEAQYREFIEICTVGDLFSSTSDTDSKS